MPRTGSRKSRCGSRRNSTGTSRSGRGDRGQAAGNFQKEARSWWRQNQGGLDPVDAELRIYQHGDCLDKQQEIARLQGRNLALTLGEMRDDYREFQFSISTLDAGVIAKRAAQNALDAQELIGHPMRTRDRYGEWTAESLRDELAAHLAKNGGRRIDPERVEQVFRDLEHIVDYGERLAALESDPRADAGCQHPMDRATEELVDWAIQNGEFNRWAQGKALGYDLDQAEREIFQLRLERENHLQELYGRAPDPAGEIPENVMQWARISQQERVLDIRLPGGPGRP